MWSSSRDERANEAQRRAKAQHDANPDAYDLAEFVENLPVGTRFIDMDDLGRKTPMMRVFGGYCITDNGSVPVGFIYGDQWTDGYSVEITYRPTETV